MFLRKRTISREAIAVKVVVGIARMSSGKEKHLNE